MHMQVKVAHFEIQNHCKETRTKKMAAIFKILCLSLFLGLLRAGRASKCITISTAANFENNHRNYTYTYKYTYTYIYIYIYIYICVCTLCRAGARLILKKKEKEIRYVY